VSDQGSPRHTLHVPAATAYAIRAWYTGVLSQTQAVRQDLVARIDAAEAEVGRLNEQVNRSDVSIEALQHVLDTIDDWIRRLASDEHGAQKGASRPRARSGASRRRRAAQGEERHDEELDAETQE
jgi:hypothetical protein